MSEKEEFEVAREALRTVHTRRELQRAKKRLEKARKALEESEQ
ncbi:hypothetical protein ES702_01399 [subsurface metagenome]